MVHVIEQVNIYLYPKFEGSIYNTFGEKTTSGFLVMWLQKVFYWGATLEIDMVDTPYIGLQFL